MSFKVFDEQRGRCAGSATKEQNRKRKRKLDFLISNEKNCAMASAVSAGKDRKRILLAKFLSPISAKERRESTSSFTSVLPILLRVSQRNEVPVLPNHLVRRDENLFAGILWDPEIQGAAEQADQDGDAAGEEPAPRAARCSRTRSNLKLLCVCKTARPKELCVCLISKQNVPRGLAPQSPKPLSNIPAGIAV